MIVGSRLRVKIEAELLRLLVPVPHQLAAKYGLGIVNSSKVSQECKFL